MGNLDIGLSTHIQAKRAHYEINPQHYQYLNIGIRRNPLSGIFNII